jgi:PAS domain-containing protein
MRPPVRAQPIPLRPDEVVTDEKLAALDALPVCAQIITYEAPTPRNFWANRLYLSLMGMTLEELLAQDLSAHTDLEKSEWEHRFHATQQLGEVLVERSTFSRALGPVQLENVVQPILFKAAGGEAVSAALVTGWPVLEMEASTKYMTSLLECSPYPLCFFTFDGHLINCNPAARKVFGNTIWLQSDIFGMDERERRGLSNVQQDEGSFRIERGGRRTAYDNMMDALSIDGASFEVCATPASSPSVLLPTDCPALPCLDTEFPFAHPLHRSMVPHRTVGFSLGKRCAPLLTPC